MIRVCLVWYLLLLLFAARQSDSCAAPAGIMNDPPGGSSGANTPRAPPAIGADWPPANGEACLSPIKLV
jgi:hypothetical protein